MGAGGVGGDGGQCGVVGLVGPVVFRAVDTFRRTLTWLPQVAVNASGRASAVSVVRNQATRSLAGVAVLGKPSPVARSKSEIAAELGLSLLRTAGAAVWGPVKPAGDAER